jgi:microcystin degradation protein MlrC
VARIAVAGLHHETNTFAPQPATFERFVEASGWPELLRGPAVLERTAPINLPIAGFAAAARAAGHELVPLLWAAAGPSGRVTTDAYERITGWLLADLRAALPVDAVHLDLHGAMVTDDLDDGEGELLARVRALVGPEVPVTASLDLHANVSEAMVDAADALVAYRTYPHVDMAETGGRVLPLLERMLAGLTLHKACRRGGYLVPLPWQCSSLPPARDLYALAATLERRIQGSVSLLMGFPAADVPCCGPSFLAYALDPAAAERACTELADAYAASEERFAGRFWDPVDAVTHAVHSPGRGPVILADTQDNPGGGGTGDTTGLLAALVGLRAERAALGLLFDPETARAAHAAGEGVVLKRHGLGGRHGPAGVTPLVADWRVERLGDGGFTATGPFYRGSRMELGPMALLRPAEAPGVAVAVASRRVQAADQAMFRCLGVDPAALAVLALKSSVHFRADFEPLAREVLIVAAPGFVAADPAELPFRRLAPELRLHPRAANA